MRRVLYQGDGARALERRDEFVARRERVDRLGARTPRQKDEWEEPRPHEGGDDDADEPWPVEGDARDDDDETAVAAKVRVGRQDLVEHFAESVDEVRRRAVDVGSRQVGEAARGAARHDRARRDAEEDGVTEGVGVRVEDSEGAAGVGHVEAARAKADGAWRDPSHVEVGAAAAERSQHDARVGQTEEQRVAQHVSTSREGKKNLSQKRKYTMEARVRAACERGATYTQGGLNVPHLRSQLRARHLDDTGPRAALVRRLCDRKARLTKRNDDFSWCKKKW